MLTGQEIIILTIEEASTILTALDRLLSKFRPNQRVNLIKETNLCQIMIDLRGKLNWRESNEYKI